MSPSELMSTAEVAALFRVSTSTVNRWAISGRLTPAVQAPGPNGARLFRRAEVEALAGTHREVHVV